MQSRRGRAWSMSVASRLAIWGLLLPAIPSLGRAAEEPEAWQSPERLITRLYDLVTFPAGTTPDWDEVRACFLEQALIVLRTAPEATTVFTVEGFVEDFVSFIERADARRTGFTERIVNMKPMVFGDIAHVLVLYEASVPGSAKPPRQGVDSFQLIRKDGRWWIVSVTNELPTPERSVPPELRD